MTDSKNIALSFDHISFSYKSEKQSVSIMEDLRMAVSRGEFVSIVGASGSGKTTIFRLIVGLEQPTNGSIHIEGEKIHNRLGKVGYMPQQDLLMPWRTIRQNASIPLEIKQQTHSNGDRVSELLNEFGLKGYEDKYPHELSGGMRQRVSFLRATLSGSNLLLLDEPFSALDAMTKLFMQEWLLEQWEQRESTILFITHDISEAIFLSDRILVITDTPFTTLEQFDVPLERPRHRQDLNKPEVIALKSHLIERFRMRM